MKIKSLLLSFVVISFSLHSFSFVTDHPTAPYKKKFTKNVWCLIKHAKTENEALFMPFNEFRPGWDVSKWAHTEAAYENHKKAIKFNLWSILRYHVMIGNLTAYCPFNPNWVDTKDHGFLMFPITPEKYGSTDKGNFFSDQKFRRFIKEGFLGYTDFYSPLIPLKSKIYLEQDSVNENGDIVYYPREYIWYEDKDIIQYKIREHWVMTEDGSVVDKEIVAIAPVIHKVAPNGKDFGHHELFWINYSKLESILKEYFIYSDKAQEEKIMSFQKYFDKRKFVSETINQDSVYVKPVK